jgi:hypothetical protein
VIILRIWTDACRDLLLNSNLFFSKKLYIGLEQELCLSTKDNFKVYYVTNFLIPYPFYPATFENIRLISLFKILLRLINSSICSGSGTAELDNASVVCSRDLA